MPAKDYSIAIGLFGAYIARISKRNPNMMTSDKKEISKDEIYSLIEFFLEDFCVNNRCLTMSISSGGESIIEMTAKGKLKERIEKQVNQIKENEKEKKTSNSN